MREYRLPPGPTELPLIGSTLKFARDPLGFLKACRRKYGPIVRINLARLPTYILFDPPLIAEVFEDRGAEYVKDRLFRDVLKILGNGLLSNEGPSWKTYRRVVQGAMRVETLHQFIPILARSTGAFLARWQLGAEINLYKEIMELTRSNVAQVLFGEIDGADSERVGQAVEAAMDHYTAQLTSAVAFPEYIPTPANIRYRRAKREILAFIDEILRNAATRKSGRFTLHDRIVDSATEQKVALGESQLKDELLTLFIAGHETTALHLIYTLHLLSHHPEVFDAVHREVSEFGDSSDSIAAALDGLRYTEWVLNESLRLYPPVWVVGREAVTDKSTIGEFDVALGTQVLMPQWVVHRDERFFSEAGRFLPERWDDDLAERLPRYSFFPFGGGPRVCIGKLFSMMHAKVVLAAVVARFRPTPRVPPAIDLQPSVTLRPRKPIHVRLERVA